MFVDYCRNSSLCSQRSRQVFYLTCIKSFFFFFIFILFILFYFILNLFIVVIMIIIMVDC